jgi:hypothetical protein
MKIGFGLAKERLATALDARGTTSFLSGSPQSMVVTLENFCCANGAMTSAKVVGVFARRCLSFVQLAAALHHLLI